MNRNSAFGRGALVLLAVLFVGLTVLSSYLLRGARLDLTQNHLYTIAPGTDRILKSLKEPVNLYFFLTDKSAGEVPAIKTYGIRVREFLEELAARSHGKLRLTVIDPQPFSEDEDRASEFGLRAVPIGGGGDKLYFGLAGTNSTDGRAIVDFFDPSKEEFLEYDIAKLIYQLGQTHKPVVGWLSSLPMNGGMDPATGQPTEPWTVLSQAEQLFTVRQLEPSLTKIDADVDVLVLVHPKHLPPAAEFAIDQFALRSGRLLVYVDPIAEQDPASGEPSDPAAGMPDRGSHLERLLTAWGVDFDPRYVVGDLEHALSVTVRRGEEPVTHLGILGLDASDFTKGEVVTAGLSNVNVATIGFLRPHKGASTHFAPILTSSAAAGLIPVERFAMLFDPSTLREGFRPTGERYVFAARVTGNVKSAFPDGAPAGVALAPGTTPLAASAKPLNLVIYADTDMLADYLWVRQQNFFGQTIAQAWASNGDLAWNTLDNLAGSTDLIGVRGRASFTRPFERVEALRRAAEDRFRATEQELESQLRETEDKLTALETQRNDKSALILTPEQDQELARFQQQKLRIRKELRDVRLGLDQEIKALGNRLKFLNIVAVPLAVAVVALGLGAWRASARRRRRERDSRDANARPPEEP
jgi:ABC-type uncharacterized transport system involved in gliding motility auxiliary subunit